jgi:hypothetical protein
MNLISGKILVGNPIPNPESFHRPELTNIKPRANGKNPKVRESGTGNLTILPVNPAQIIRITGIMAVNKYL